MPTSVVVAGVEAAVSPLEPLSFAACLVFDLDGGAVAVGAGAVITGEEVEGAGVAVAWPTGEVVARVKAAVAVPTGGVMAGVEARAGIL